MSELTAVSVAASTAPVIRIRLRPRTQSRSHRGSQRAPSTVAGLTRWGLPAKRPSSSCRRHRLRPASEDACARLPSPNRDQIAVSIMSASNDTGPGRQIFLNDPKLLGSGPSPSPLWTGQNRNRRHVCSFACKLMSKSSHARAQSGKAALTGRLPTIGVMRRTASGPPRVARSPSPGASVTSWAFIAAARKHYRTRDEVPGA